MKIEIDHIVGFVVVSMIFLFFGGITILCYGISEGDQKMKTQACERGLAEWKLNNEGKACFTWKEVAK